MAVWIRIFRNSRARRTMRITRSAARSEPAVQVSRWTVDSVRFDSQKGDKRHELQQMSKPDESAGTILQQVRHGLIGGAGSAFGSDGNARLGYARKNRRLTFHC